MKSIHYFRPHHVVTRNGGYPRLTACAIENKTAAYESSTHAEKVTCQRCLDNIEVGFTGTIRRKVRSRYDNGGKSNG